MFYANQVGMGIGYAYEILEGMRLKQRCDHVWDLIERAHPQVWNEISPTFLLWTSSQYAQIKYKPKSHIETSSARNGRKKVAKPAERNDPPKSFSPNPNASSVASCQDLIGILSFNDVQQSPADVRLVLGSSDHSPC